MIPSFNTATEAPQAQRKARGRTKTEYLPDALLRVCGVSVAEPI